MSNLDDLEGQECPRCERTYPGPDYNGEPGFCCKPWSDDRDCDRIYVASLETQTKRLRSRIAEIEAALGQQHKLNLDLVTQNAKLIARNLVLGDTENGPLVRAERAEKLLAAEWGLGCGECGARWMDDAALDKMSDLVEPYQQRTLAAEAALGRAEREAWFKGWTAAINWAADREDAKDNARLVGDTLQWREPPHPPNPYPPQESDQGKEGEG